MSLRTLVTPALRPISPRALSATGFTLASAVETFGALPFASVIPTFQCPGLRKHPGVGLTHLLQTSASPCGEAPWSTKLSSLLSSSVLQDGVVDGGWSFLVVAVMIYDGRSRRFFSRLAAATISRLAQSKNW